jgi:hypothetical protein
MYIAKNSQSPLYRIQILYFFSLEGIPAETKFELSQYTYTQHSPQSVQLRCCYHNSFAHLTRRINTNMHSHS